MALNPQTTSGLSNGIITYVRKRFLDILRSHLVLAPLGQPETQGRGTGTTANWRRWTDLSAQTTALTEGVTPTGLGLTLGTVTGTLAQYGGYVTLTDILKLTFINDVMEEAVDLISRNGALTLDSLVRNEIDANFTVQYADSANNSSEANVESGADEFRSIELRRAVETLRGTDVPEFADGMYMGVIHPYAEGNLVAESATATYMEHVKYTDATPAIRGTIGSAFGVKLVRSSNIRAVSPNTNTYRNLIFGKGAFGIADIEGSSKPELIINETGAGGTEDPLKQRATVGWKNYFVAVTLQASRGIRVSAYGTA